jgi:LysM repeat protein
MAAIDPGIRRSTDLDALLRQGARLAAVAVYVTAFVVALVLLRPAFRDTPAPALEPAAVQIPATDKVRKGESVATFAARHGLELGDLLALNPRVDSLALRPGTKLRIR